MQRWGSLLFWSVISAAFIGPGTVATAASAGAGFQYQLMWALVFSVIACWVLQEAAARLPMISGKNLGETIASQYRQMFLIPHASVFAILVGGIAYQAGNILGGVKGASLILNVNPLWLTIAIGILAAGVLSWGNEQRIAQVMGWVVAVMGLAFIFVAVQGDIDVDKLFEGMFLPSLKKDATLVVMGLIGTTIVPYNLFLASGISHSQDLKTMRWGLMGAILIGGIISLAILLVGTQISGTFSFEALMVKMNESLGKWAGILFALGLFSAGFTSSITAPLAAAITARSIWGHERDDWHNRSWKFRLVWGAVMLSGILFGISGIKPIPAIILAQALNGLLLPFIAILLFVSINQKNQAGKRGNTLQHNLLMIVVIIITVILGFLSLSRVFRTVL